MLPCQRAGELICVALDTPLSLRQGIALAFHTKICVHCRRLRRQMQVIQNICQKWRGSAEASPPVAPLMSESTRDRIRKQLQEADSDGRV